MQKNLQKFPFIFPTIFLILTVTALLFLYKKINSNNQISDQISKELQTTSYQRDQMKSLARSIKLIGAEKTELENHFVSSSDAVLFLDTIEKSAGKVGVATEVASVDIVKDEELSISLKAAGTFEALYKFLTLLENSPYQVEFTSADIKKGGGEGDPTLKTKIRAWEAGLNIKLKTLTQ